MKKLLFVLLIVALASFLFVGCTPTVPAEGEGEGEGEVEGVTVAIADSAKVGDYTYVSAGSHDITVTFPTPVAGLVSASISPCSGDYTKAFIAGGSSVVLFPEATVEVCLADCTCAGCEIVFSSHTNEEECLPDEVICGDDCSGLASWSIDIFDRYPFDECCETPCYEPIESGSGVCPIDFTTSCLTDLVAGIDTVYAVVTLVDNVGNDTRFGATITFNPDTCNILTVTPWPADECVDHPTFVVCDVTGLEVNFIDVPDEDVNDGPDAVVLGNYGDYDYGDFVILSETGITNTDSHTSVINGDIGTSPETAATMNDIWCTEIIGTIVGVDAAYVGSGVQTCFAGNPPLSNKTWVDNAILNMVTVYNTTAGIPNPDGIDLYGGNIGGQTFAPGLYKWNSDVIIPTSVTLSGGANDVWIFQIAGDLSISPAGGIE